MAGRKTFTSGEILTAADVNSFLMDQSVMVFDDSAARGSAIPSPSEGMTTYLKDQNQLQVYDGSQFGPVGSVLQVVSTTKTDTQVNSSVASGALVTVSGLTITHALSSASNKVILIGQLSGQIQGVNNIGGVVTADGTPITRGDAAGDRARVAGINSAAPDNFPSTTTIIAEYSPGTTSSIDYDLKVVNLRAVSATVYVNRSVGDGDEADRPRSVSTLTLMEVAG